MSQPDTVAELETLGKRIARRRRALGWNQKVLAARAGCRPAQISKYERDNYEPGLSTLSRIAAVMETSIDYLMTGKEPQDAEPDLLRALWPALEQLPLGLRNEIAGFLNTVLRAGSLLRSSPAVKPARRGSKRRRAKKKSMSPPAAG